eukprot:scaffold149507_cov22-Tisochrysis_lutea.AAC.1
MALHFPPKVGHEQSSNSCQLEVYTLCACEFQDAKHIIVKVRKKALKLEGIEHDVRCTYPLAGIKGVRVYCAEENKGFNFKTPTYTHRNLKTSLRGTECTANYWASRWRYLGRRAPSVRLWINVDVPCTYCASGCFLYSLCISVRVGAFYCHCQVTLDGSLCMLEKNIIQKERAHSSSALAGLLPCFAASKDLCLPERPYPAIRYCAVHIDVSGHPTLCCVPDINVKELMTEFEVVANTLQQL